jgi:hypothetical protein
LRCKVPPSSSLSVADSADVNLSLLPASLQATDRMQGRVLQAGALTKLAPGVFRQPRAAAALVSCGLLREGLQACVQLDNADVVRGRAILAACHGRLCKNA